MPEKRLHLLYIDGIRALTCLYVVFHHAYLYLYLDDGIIKFAKILDFLGILTLMRGHDAVVVFIFISGFCLMLPCAAKNTTALNARSFFYRRALRILPPYYFAFLCSVLLYSFIPALNADRSGFWNIALPAVTLSSVVSHFFLFQHFSTGWQFKLNVPMWSIGVEWWLYFLMPFLLLPLFRNLTRPVFLVAIMGGGAICDFLQTRYTQLNYFGHFFAIFSVGMVVTWQIFVVQKSPAWLRYLGIVCGLAYIGLILLNVRHSLQTVPLIRLLGEIQSKNHWISDYLLIGFVASMIVRFHTAEEWKTTIGNLSTRWLNHIGHFSYSIYLIHDPVLRLMYLVQAHAGWSLPLRYFWMLGLGTTASIAAGYLCYLIVERHFISSRP